MKYRNTVVGYPTSKDYKSLWQFMQKQSVICFIVVQTGNYVRQELYETMFDGKDFVIGNGLIYASDEKNFVKQCKRADLRFIVPTANQEKLDD